MFLLHVPGYQEQRSLISTSYKNKKEAGIVV